MPYFLLITTAVTLAALTRVVPRHGLVLGWALGLSLMLFAGLRGSSIDYSEYVTLFDLMRDTGLEFPERLLIGKDILFGALMAGVQALDLGPQALFLSAAILSVGLKQYAFTRVFGTPAVALLVTLCSYYFLHDFTQIRAGIAIALCFVSLVALCDHQPRWAVLTGLLAVGFHASAILFLPFAGLAQLRGRRAWWATGIALLALLSSSHLLFGELAAFDERTATQLDQTGTSLIPLLIGGVRLAALAMIYRDARSHWPRRRQLLRTCFLLCVVAVCLQIGLRDLSTALAFRSFELLDAFAVFIIAAVLIRGSTIARLIALALCAQQLALNVYAGLLPPYTLGSF